MPSSMETQRWKKENSYLLEKKDVFVNIALRVMSNLAAMGPKHLGRGYNHVLHVNATEIPIQIDKLK